MVDCFDFCMQTYGVKMGDEAELIAQGWRRCAIGQTTTQWCAQAEEQRQRDEELLRMALEALEQGAWDTLRGRNAAADIRERLGEKV